jgi:phosphatidylserine decarboxylase
MTKHSDSYFPFHHEGFPYMGGAALITIFLAVFGWKFFLPGLLVTAWVFYFFRDPGRVTPVRPGLIVSPADGKIVAIQEVEPDDDIGLDKAARTRISIFLNIFDVHVNRIPADGTVVSRNYRKGKFFNAALDKASVDNERMSVVIQLTGEHPRAEARLGVVQIAGLIARRIVCTVQKDETVLAGERYGIIRFGSRVDVYLPQGVQPLVSVGQYMLGGETVLADCASSETARQAEKRE